MKNTNLCSRNGFPTLSYFLQIFKPCCELNSVNSEKGMFRVGQTKFDIGSIFNVVEKECLKKCLMDTDYLICDDLGKEWADHILVTNEKIVFYHSKYKGSTFSATDFQDIVGQAQKNLGNLNPQESQLSSKKATEW